MYISLVTLSVPEYSTESACMCLQSTFSIHQPMVFTAWCGCSRCGMARFRLGPGHEVPHYTTTVPTSECIHKILRTEQSASHHHVMSKARQTLLQVIRSGKSNSFGLQPSPTTHALPQRCTQHDTHTGKSSPKTRWHLSTSFQQHGHLLLQRAHAGPYVRSASMSGDLHSQLLFRHEKCWIP